MHKFIKECTPTYHNPPYPETAIRYTTFQSVQRLILQSERVKPLGHLKQNATVCVRMCGTPGSVLAPREGSPSGGCVKNLLDSRVPHTGTLHTQHPTLQCYYTTTVLTITNGATRPTPSYNSGPKTHFLNMAFSLELSVLWAPVEPWRCNMAAPWKRTCRC